jgi:hypothetical protein
MRRWNKPFMIVALLSSILIVSAVFSSGVVDVSTFSLGGSSPAGAPESSSTPGVAVLPDSIRGDYAVGWRVGDTFQIVVNVTHVTDLYAWQINMSWNPSILNLNNIIAGEFLNRSGPTANTTSYELGFVINVTDNGAGYTAMGESILGGVPGQNDNGTLVTIELLIVGYGDTNLTIVDVGGTLPTTLLNSTLSSIVPTIADGYFSSRYISDFTGPEDPPGSGIYPPDGKVDNRDYSFIGAAFGKTSASPGWETYKDADTTGPAGPNPYDPYPPDDKVDNRDYSYCGSQFGNAYP